MGATWLALLGRKEKLALPFAEAELYAIGQGVSEALFLRSMPMLLESELAKKASVIARNRRVGPLEGTIR